MRPLLAALAAACALLVAAAPSAAAAAAAEAAKNSTNKFRQREASDDMLGYPHLDEDSLLKTKCPKHVELRWQTEVSSSIFATPLIADINSDGKLEVVVPSFVHYLEVLEGTDGDKLPGWPAFHQSNAHSSPLLYDIDKDGVREIALATYNGVVNFFRVSGYVMMDKLEVPRRKVRKDWYVGLNPDPVDRSHPDVHDNSIAKEAAFKESPPVDQNKPGSMEGGEALKNASEGHSVETKPNSTQAQENVELLNIANNTHSENISSVTTAADTSQTQRRLLQTADKSDDKTGSSNTHENDSGAKAATVENDEPLEEDADASFDLFRDPEDLPDEYNYDYDDYVDESMWGDEDWKEEEHEKAENYVSIDAHILSTPVIADIDKDGVQEMVIAVSYFFDHEYYDNPEHAKELEGIDIGKYVASGIVVFNLDTRQVKWTAELDLSTDSVNFRAHVYSSPTVVDLDGDGYLDILVGTGYGLFYVIDHRGKVRNKFPLEMAEIHAPVIAADINDDGKIEMEWRSSNQGRNNAAYRHNRQGIYVKHGSRTFRDEEGKNFWLEFEIVDKYRVPYGNQAPYNVTVTLLVPGNYQGDRRIVVSSVYHEPGKQRLMLPTVPVRTTGTVVVEMVDKNGLYFSDEFSLTFHMHYYKLLKWLVLLPMLGMFGVLVILRSQEGARLPSFSRNID
nr:unnamed protein product [Digitaria exilis]